MTQRTGQMPAWNLALRFVLELAAFAGLAYLGWPNIFLAIVLPLVGATLWGVFNVPGDPSRSGRAPVAVPGVVRLAVELLVLFGGAAGFFFGGAKVVGVVLALLIVLHLAFSGQRLAWLVKR